MSLKKIEKIQDALQIKLSSINTESQKRPAECRVKAMAKKFTTLDYCQYLLSSQINYLID